MKITEKDLGKKREDIIIEPISGKAIPVYKGEIIRIIQLEGGQTVDFNCFNLEDYKEHMSVSRTRRKSFTFKEGDLIWSNRFRPMLTIAYSGKSCLHDLVAPGCNAFFFDLLYDFEDVHPNCQDTFAETIGEYGLTPDDVHESLNMWMNTVESDNYKELWNPAVKGDYVDLLALMDVLAVPITCGSGDVRIVSNFSLKPIQIQVFKPSSLTAEIANDYWKRYSKLKSQRSVEDFRIKEIKKDRKLEPIPGYKPHYPQYPLKLKPITIELNSEEIENLNYLKENCFPGSDEEVIRAAVICWYNENIARSNIPLYKADLKSLMDSIED